MNVKINSTLKKDIKKKTDHLDTLITNLQTAVGQRNELLDLNNALLDGKKRGDVELETDIQDLIEEYEKKIDEYDDFANIIAARAGVDPRERPLRMAPMPPKDPAPEA
jgi:hypothetical protein